MILVIVLKHIVLYHHQFDNIEMLHDHMSDHFRMPNRIQVITQEIIFLFDLGNRFKNDLPDQETTAQ